VANLNEEQLRRLARLGAVARLEQLRSEEAAIRAEFPELFGGGRGRGRKGARRGSGGAAPAKAATRRRRRKVAMTPEQRKAVSERMKRYWAERRKAKGTK